MKLLAAQFQLAGKGQEVMVGVTIALLCSTVPLYFSHNGFITLVFSSHCHTTLCICFFYDIRMYLLLSNHLLLFDPHDESWNKGQEIKLYIHLNTILSS